MRHIIRVTKVAEFSKGVTATLNPNPKLALNPPDLFAYTSLPPRLQRIADRLYTLDPETNIREHGVTDFAFVTRPSKLGGGFHRNWYED